MELDPNACYRALRTRDRRFDGRFFTGVTSTGVYCRPVCPARTPKRGNCEFFPHAAAAEESGYRPCLRCRPETSPGTPTWQGTSAAVSRALRMIDDGALDRGGVDDLAARVGLGGRHLRRLFVEHLGAPPLAVAMTRRVHFAKRLLEETRIPIVQVAIASGFNNVRRFNAAFRNCFDRTPNSIRRAGREAGPGGDRDDHGAITLRMAFRPPLAWDSLLAYLAPRAIPGVEQVEGDTYRRTVALDGVRGVMTVSPDATGECLVLRVPGAGAPHLFEVAERVRTQFDLTADPGIIDDQLGNDPDLARLRVPAGLRVPGSWDRFELAVRAILGQQVSVTGATTLSGRFVRAFGTRLSDPPDIVAEDPCRSDVPAWMFPRPADVARASAQAIAALGIPTARAAAIRGLARAVSDGSPVLEPSAGLEESVARLTALDGIGEWTAQYIAMRALREPDAFPAGDLGLRKALAGDDGPLTARALARRSDAWRPWRAYAAIRLWSAPPLRQENR